MDIQGILGAALSEAFGGGGGTLFLYVLAAIGLNLHFGYAGLLNFGQAGFVAVGAYGIAITVSSLGMSLWYGILFGILGAIVLALLLGIPTLRLRADYLSIATIAAAEIIRLVITAGAKDITGGSNGLSQFAGDFRELNPYPAGRYGFWRISVDQNQLWLITIGWILIIIFSVLMWLLVTSPWGRTLKGIREDEDAVRALGKNVYAFKMQALVIGGVIGAFAGFMSALAATAVQPNSYSTELTFFVYTVLLLGGAARIFGPILGAAIFWAFISLTEGLLKGAISAGFISEDLLTATEVGQLRWILMGLVLMGLMVFRPQGILGDKREIAITAR